MKPHPLTFDLKQADHTPYFLWDEPTTLVDFQKILRAGSPEKKRYYLGKLLREADYPDVWRWTTPQEIFAIWKEISPYLGRKRGFWEYLLSCWKDAKLIS